LEHTAHESLKIGIWQHKRREIATRNSSFDIFKSKYVRGKASRNPPA
jgi:hypothetical protein